MCNYDRKWDFFILCLLCSLSFSTSFLKIELRKNNHHVKNRHANFLAVAKRGVIFRFAIYAIKNWLIWNLSCSIVTPSMLWAVNYIGRCWTFVLIVIGWWLNKRKIGDPWFRDSKPGKMWEKPEPNLTNQKLQKSNYLSYLRTHFALVFSSSRSVWRMCNMATIIVSTMVTGGTVSTLTWAFGRVDRLRDDEPGLTGTARGWRWRRGWRVTAMAVEAGGHLLRL